MTDWTLKSNISHNYLPTSITSIKNIHIETNLDMKHHNILNCPTLNKYLIHNPINQPIVKGSLISYGLNNEIYTNSIIVNNDNINLNDKCITNCSGINNIKFTNKVVDFQNKRISSVGNPKFLNDVINKGYLLEELKLLRLQIDDLKNEITAIKKNRTLDVI